MSNNEVVSFTTMALATGKGVKASDKLAQHLRNGADAAALAAVGVNSTLITNAFKAEGIERVAKALAAGNIRPAYAVVVARLGKSQALMEVNGKAPYSEWLRLGATIGQMAQTNSGGKPTAACRALAVFRQIQGISDAVRSARMDEQKALVEAAAAA